MERGTTLGILGRSRSLKVSWDRAREMDTEGKHEPWGLWNRVGASGKMMENFSKKSLIIQRQALGSFRHPSIGP